MLIKSYDLLKNKYSKTTNRRYRKVNIPTNKIREEINSVEEMLSIDHNFG